MKTLIRNLTTIGVLSGLHLIGWSIYYPNYIASLSEWSHWIPFIVGGIVMGAVGVMIFTLWTLLGYWSSLKSKTEVDDFFYKIISILITYALLILLVKDSIYFQFVMISFIISVLVLSFDYKNSLKNIFHLSL